MAEHRLFPAGAVPEVSTPEFHAHRDRAPHLEQPGHRPRLLRAAQLVMDAADRYAPGGGRWHESTPWPVTVSDLGCGDGGLLSLVRRMVARAWGYDFQPSNAAGWAERGVTAAALDVFGADRDKVRLGDVTVMTEVLEHLADPHGAARWVAGRSRFLVASSPWDETPQAHDECHAWAWDLDGYSRMLAAAGWSVLRHEPVGRFQVVLAERVAA